MFDIGFWKSRGIFVKPWIVQKRHSCVQEELVVNFFFFAKRQKCTYQHRTVCHVCLPGCDFSSINLCPEEKCQTVQAFLSSGRDYDDNLPVRQVKCTFTYSLFVMSVQLVPVFIWVVKSLLNLIVRKPVTH